MRRSHARAPTCPRADSLRHLCNDGSDELWLDRPIVGHKNGWCVMDLGGWDVPGNDRRQHQCDRGTSGEEYGFDCVDQGISPGCYDEYVDSIECCRKHVAVRVRALAPAGPPAAGPTGAPCVAQEPSRLRSFWRKRKMRHYLREAETVLTISHLGLAPEVRERLTRQRRRGLRASRAQTTLWLSGAPSD